MVTGVNEPDPPVLSIGAVFGGSPEIDELWKPEIQSLRRQIMELRVEVTSPLSVNVVYHVDGPLVPNEFEGVRTGTFSRKTMHLMVQAAVPAGSGQDHRGRLTQLLRDAVDEAEAFARRRKIADDLRDIRSIVDALATN